MKKSRVLTLGLACFFTAVTGLSTLAATTGGGCFLADNHAGLSRFEGGSAGLDGINENQNGVLSPQERLYNGTLGLDPENDPVIYTTDYGLEIRYANSLTNTNIASYTYFEAGGYNWVIIGYDPSMSAYVGEFSGETPITAGLIEGGNQLYETIDNSPAGKAIANEFACISFLAKPNDEIGDGCVLCLSENNITNQPFGTSTIYSTSNLRDYICNQVYDKNDQLKKLPIVQKELLTADDPAEPKLRDHLFALATINRSEDNFAVENYLSGNQRISCNAGTTIPYHWWTRSHDLGYSNSIYNVNADTNVKDNGYVGISIGVRPAFVLQL